MTDLHKLPSRKERRKSSQKRRIMQRMVVLGSVGALTVVAPLSGFVGSDLSFAVPSQVVAAATASDSWADADMATIGAQTSNDMVSVSDADSVTRVRTAQQACRPRASANGDTAAFGSEKVLLYPLPIGSLNMTSPYAVRVSPMGDRNMEMHRGVDWATAQGTPVTAASDGVVVFQGDYGSGGNAIAIRHEGEDGVFYTKYLHLVYGSQVVSKGETVKAGQMIARVGTTGRSTGPHLHFEVHIGRDGNTTDPVPWMKQHGAKHIGNECG